MSERKTIQKIQKYGSIIDSRTKIEQFILRNSRNGFFTKVSTINYKFEISESRAWEVIGELLFDGNIESIHDQYTGDMKLCENGKTYSIMELENTRKRDKFRKKNKTKSTKINKK